jgi:uncharacterized protein
MKKLLLVILILIPALINCQAQTKQENIKVLFQLMQTDSVVEKMMNSMIPLMMKSIPQQQDSTAMSMMNATMKKITDAMMDITKRLMNEDMLAIYDKYYTEKDIKDLVAFYKSSAGQKMVKVTPDLNKEMMMILVTKYIPELQSKLKF